MSETAPTAAETDALLASFEANMDRLVAEGRAALARSQRKAKRARLAAARAALADYYADGPAAIAAERIARGEYVTISVAADGTRTVTNGPGL